MLLRNLQFSITFLLIFVVQLIAISDEEVSKLVLADFHYAIKPLITISLMSYLFYKTRFKGRFSRRIGLGLLFGLGGDVFLMLTHIHPNMFIFGLISFLIGHLLYIAAFFIDFKWDMNIEKYLFWFSIIGFGSFCVFYYLYLSPHLGQLKIPVFFYTVIITLMAIVATNRKGRVNTVSFNLIFYGAILFLISDSVLAYNKFVHHFEFAGLAIMSTYMLAQYLITMGTIERKLKKHIAMHEQLV